MSESKNSSKWYERGILKPMGSIATGLMSIAGKCTSRFGRGLGTVGNAPGSTTGTLDEAVKGAEIGIGGIVSNLAAPINVMRTKQPFLSKTKEAAGEIVHSTIAGTAKSVALTLGDPFFAVAGVDWGRNKEGKIRPSRRAKRGILGLAIDDVLKGGLRTGTFFTGLDTPDPGEEVAAADKAAQERLERKRSWLLPRYLKKRLKGKGEKGGKQD